MSKAEILKNARRMRTLKMIQGLTKDNMDYIIKHIQEISKEKKIINKDGNFSQNTEMFILNSIGLCYIPYKDDPNVKLFLKWLAGFASPISKKQHIQLKKMKALKLIQNLPTYEVNALIGHIQKEFGLGLGALNKKGEFYKEDVEDILIFLDIDYETYKDDPNVKLFLKWLAGFASK